MKTKDQRIAALLDRKAMSDEEKLNSIRKILDEEQEETAEGEEDETTAEGEDETTAEGEDEKPAAEGEEDETAAEGEEDKVDAKNARAILDLPQAKGREKLAAELAFTSGMTPKTAAKLLAAAPKQSRLVGQVPDPKLGAGAEQSRGGAAQTDDEKAAAFVMECAAMARGQPVKK